LIRRKAPRRWLGVGIVAASILFCSLGSTASAAKHKQARPLYWGAVIGKQLTGEAPPWDMNALSTFEGLAGKGASLLEFSSPFADCIERPCTYFYFPTTAMQTIREHGTIPVLTWASQSVPSSLSEPGFRLADVANGRHDTYIRDFAIQARNWGHPFFLRFDQEMNGFWFPWGEGVNGNKPGSFVKAWRHVHDIFTEVGATNATWVWCPNVDFTRKLVPLHSLYPGGKYVDWSCLDGFNWGKTANSGGWMSFGRVFRSTYKRVQKIAPHKPMLISEVASEERGGSKAGWIRHTLKVIPRKFPKIRGLIWFEENDRGMHWPIESSPSSHKAFAKAIQRTVYRPNEFSGLVTNSPIPPPSWP
jgi:mannan endo-1,4-beta-mannosidase